MLLFRSVFAHQHAVLPVIHVASEAQALRNAEIAREAGADGVFLINHTMLWDELLDIHHQVWGQFADWWVGVNCLDLKPYEVFRVISQEVAGVWADDAFIDELSVSQSTADYVAAAREESSWQGLYFGGVAFKYRRGVVDLAGAARIASRYMDVVTTSGPGTGQAASRKKIETMKAALGEFPLAVASGITPENVANYLDVADCLLVATGISRSFTELAPPLVSSLVERVRAYRPASPRQTPMAASVTESRVDEFLVKRFVWPDFGGQRLLVVGVGGGCDIILAYAIAHMLRCTRAAEIVYANTKRADDGMLEHVSKHIGRVSAYRPHLKHWMHTHDTSLIEHSLPRGDRGCPWVVLLPEREREGDLVRELQGMGFDWLLAIDTGGDSLTETTSQGDDRDTRMMKILRSTGLPLLHIVAAPGSDGESTYEDLLAAVREAARCGRYKGCVALAPVIQLLKQCAEGLSWDRTPNIIVAAAENPPAGHSEAWRTVPRNLYPDIPHSWLTHAFVFS